MNARTTTVDYAHRLHYAAENLMVSNASDIAKLECFARTFCGINPSLKFVDLGIAHIANALVAHQGILPQQALVEAAYICMGFIRYPDRWHALDELNQSIFMHFLSKVEALLPINNNWVLFVGMVQLFKVVFMQSLDYTKIMFALNTMENWYRGDSIYSDGPDLQVDYYNSYVIHPMIFEMVSSMKNRHDFGYTIYLKRAQRYAVILENMISPEGTFPVIGRSSTYRFGAFAHLSDMLRRGLLPDELTYPGTINAITAVIDKMLHNVTGRFLPIGIVGEQAKIAEYYISSGSSFLCCMGMSHLAISREDPMWYQSYVPWTQKLIWSGDSNIVIAKGIHV